MAIGLMLDIPTDMAACIENCMECHNICERTSIQCLDKANDVGRRTLQTALRDCAELCSVCIDFMIRESPIHAHTCRACAEACQKCEEACRFFSDNDSLMLRCADVCAQCFATCRQMASMD